MTAWRLEQFRFVGRKRGGRPAQQEYRPWTPEELAAVAAAKGNYGAYRALAEQLGRSYLSVKHMGARL